MRHFLASSIIFQPISVSARTEMKDDAFMSSFTLIVQRFRASLQVIFIKVYAERLDMSLSIFTFCKTTK